MKIHDDHLYHGSALIQVAEHPRFTAINSLIISSKPSRSAYRINNRIGIYLKYAAKPVGRFKEYIFTFNLENLIELNLASEQVEKLFISFVCVKDREICCLEYTVLLQMINRRKEVKGGEEDNYTILVTIPSGKSMRVYMNYPSRKKIVLDEKKIVSRNKFPDALFE